MDALSSEVKPAWSAILLTTLIGAGQGLFLAVFFVDLQKAGAAKDLVVSSCALSLLLLAAGLVASFFHPGRPERAWRTASQWRTSWLSREVVVLPVFMALVFLYGLLRYYGSDMAMLAGSLAAICCVALFVCTAMIYACRKFLREWHTPLTFANFVLLGLASGLTLAVPLAVLRYPQSAGPLALAAFGAAALAWIVRIATLVRNARLRPKSTTQTKPVLGTVRWLFLALIFPVPAWLLGWGGGSLEVFVTAFALQFAGLLAERWYFFAEARHPQNLYDQMMA